MPDRTPQPPPRLSPRLRKQALLLIACVISGSQLYGLKHPASVWPTEREVLSGHSFFGQPGDPASLVTVPLPYPLRPSWSPDTELASITCHRFIAVPLTRIFQRTLEHYGMERIRELRLDVYGGCFNNRPIRGGSRPSLHAWGIAIDMDPERNTLYMSAPEAVFSGPEYDAFWSIVEKEGAFSLGRERNYDWMHFQFARP
ncbi:M15 family metallopeptidase [Akkermansia massiliensis]|uniref:M15 family metallopeptidase n=1 Tax=Akkermansia massiliensis TaxID=2927224 RepID=UPI00202FA12B|nr:M15 family metallopeptidase [Akkermansia sp. B2-R-115]MCM0685778.1 M15 family metallopeptidase [Akkermansia sp. B2-R-115]